MSPKKPTGFSDVERAAMEERAQLRGIRGYAPGMPEGESDVGSMIELGFGYTWRR